MDITGPTHADGHDAKDSLPIAMSDKQAMDNPCLDCGVCCRSFRVSFYHGELWVPEEMISRISPFLACMKGTEHGDGPCVALKDNLCAIYDNRPSTCRDFPALVGGQRNPVCTALRARSGIG